MKRPISGAKVGFQPIVHNETKISLENALIKALHTVSLLENEVLRTFL